MSGKRWLERTVKTLPPDIQARAGKAAALRIADLLAEAYEVAAALPLSACLPVSLDKSRLVSHISHAHRVATRIGGDDDRPRYEPTRHRA